MKKKEKENKTTQEYYKQKKDEAEQLFKSKLDQQRQAEEQKRQELRRKFQKNDERYQNLHNQMEEFKDQLYQNRSQKMLSYGKNRNLLSNKKTSYKFLMVKKLIDKGQRGENVQLQHQMISEVGYTNHRSRLIEQLRALNKSQEQ